MRLKPIIFSSFIAATLVGCAGANSKSELMARQINDLTASLSETNARVDDLNNKFMLLFEKVEASKDSAKKSDAVSAAQALEAAGAPDMTEPAKAPEGLKVVSLGEEAEQKKAEEVKAPEVKAPEVKALEVKAPEVKAKKADLKKAGSPDEIYSKGQDLFLSGKYGEAREVFASLVKGFPGSPLADNALYWAGETYYSEKDFRKAADIFNEVPAKFPTGNKAPDALLKAGFSYLELKDRQGADRAFERLLKEYPGSDAAIRAKKTIEKLANQKK